MNEIDQSVVAILLILMVIASFAVGSLLVYLTGHWMRKSAVKDFSLGATDFARSPQDPDNLIVPFLFDRPTKWMAIRCTNLIKVQSALGLINPMPCSWAEGFSKCSESKLFISPPVNGWILVVGQGLPEPSDDIDHLYHFLMNQGRELGTILYFHANKVFNHHAWVRIENEQVYRAYAWAGETLWNQGEMTAAEKELDLKCYDYGDGPLPFPFSAREAQITNTEKVIQLAARWSIDPMALNSRNLKASLGIAGDLMDIRAS
ncbi:MAG: hypothetical protein ACO1QB_00020 [Verrucomicrobiales bacterium]